MIAFCPTFTGKLLPMANGVSANDLFPYVDRSRLSASAIVRRTCVRFCDKLVLFVSHLTRGFPSLSCSSGLRLGVYLHKRAGFVLQYIKRDILQNICYFFSWSWLTRILCQISYREAECACTTMEVPLTFFLI